jgi:hypothetical protein
MFSSRQPLLAPVFVMAATILAISPSAASATFTFAPINDPAGFNTEARGINSSGEIAGFYQTDASCTESQVDIRYLPTCHKHGFTYVDGKYKTHDVPGAVSTVVNGLNDLGDLVGVYLSSDGVTHGFLWLHTGAIEILAYPKASSTTPMSINKSGVVVGQFNGGYSFRWVNGKFSFISVNSGPGCPNCNGLSGIANNDAMVGFAFHDDSWVGFLKNGSDFDFFPRFNDGDSFTDAVNDKIDIVGYGIGHAYFAPSVEANEGSPESEKSPDYIPFKYTGGYPTQPFGINDSRAIVGAYEDSTGIHGFLALYQ